MGFEGGWSEVVEGGVNSLGIVVGQVASDIAAGLATVLVFGQFQLGLDSAEAGFHESVVVAFGGATPALRLTTPTQPVAIDDALAYLVAAKDWTKGESRIFEIGSPDVVTYGDLIREYARQQGLRRWLIFVPVLTPYLSGLWLALVKPASFEVGRHLNEGLKKPTVVRDSKALDVFSIRPMRVKEAIRSAIAGAT